MRRWLMLMLLFGAAAAFSESNCGMSPDNDEDNVIDQSGQVTLQCSFDNPVKSCLWMHNEPMNEERGNSDDPADIECTGSAGQVERQCNSDSRIEFIFSSNMCGITIGNIRPEDSGKWRLNAFSTSQSQGSVANHEFTLYTFNRSIVEMFDIDDTEVDHSDVDTTYNYNERQNDWEEGKTGWENLEFSALAYGGRPEPTFTWYIGNRGDDLYEHRDVFRISTGSLGCKDRYGMICDAESTISFGVDDVLMEKLETFGVETNPKDELVRFELNCDVEQGGSSFTQKLSVQINVEKSYDNGALPASTIGIIIGVILAILILLIAIAILVFAKRSGVWCFADEDYDYRDPKDPRSQPRGGPQRGAGPIPRKEGQHRSGGGGSGGSGGRSGHQQQQVHSATIAGRESMPSPVTKMKPEDYLTSSSSSSSSPTIPRKVAPSSSSSDNAKKVPSSMATPTPPSTKSSGGATPKKIRYQQGEWLAAGAPPPTTGPSSTSSPSDDDEEPLPPPRPDKKPVHYANLDRRSFMNDPRNRVLPSQPLVPRQSPPWDQPASNTITTTTKMESTEYAQIVSSSKYV